MRERALTGLGWTIVLDLFIQAFVRAAARRAGRKSDFAWNFLISKRPEKKIQCRDSPNERMKSSLRYKGARTSGSAALARLPISRSAAPVVSPTMVFEKRPGKGSLISGYAAASG